MANYHWTHEQEEYVLKNYKEMPTKKIALKLGKTEGSVRTRYNDLLKNIEGPNKIKPALCPICGGLGNKVSSCINHSVKTVYYCTNCLIEFKGSKLIPPLLDEETEECNIKIG